MVHAVRVFLAGAESHHWVFKNNDDLADYRPYVLESFANVNDGSESTIPMYGDFLLDSGAFTFCGTGRFSPDKFDEYLERYADFINRNHVEKFFELDVDSITGYDKVLEYRRKLERLTGKPSIPVWHISRGKDEFLRHCDEYPYVALGGYVAAIKASDPRQQAYVRSYPWFISQAHKRGKKIHGLGFTNTEMLKRYHFDSVDSTTWLVGARFGNICELRKDWTIVQKHLDGKRCVKSKELIKHNFGVWIKFQKYAETHL